MKQKREDILKALNDPLLLEFIETLKDMEDVLETAQTPFDELKKEMRDIEVHEDETQETSSIGET